MQPYRRSSGFAPGDWDDSLTTPPEFLELPVEHRHLFDLDDPDIEYVARSIRLLKSAGLDVTDLDILILAVEGGHRYAAQVNDDTQLQGRREVERDLEVARRHRAWAEKRESRARIYYARIGNRCKIGYSLNVQARMHSITPEELLVTEPGGPIKEAERHAQFETLRSHGREWFRYEDALVEHVRHLRRITA